MSSNTDRHGIDHHMTDQPAADQPTPDRIADAYARARVRYFTGSEQVAVVKLRLRSGDRAS